MTTKTTRPTTDPDVRTLHKIYDIYDPWIATTTEREEWLVTLPSGTTVTLMIPLGAAVEIETAGSWPNRIANRSRWGLR